MPRLVKGPDGKIHSFPDDATDDQIRQALTAGSSGPSLRDFMQNGPGWRDYAREAAEGLPLVGTTVGGIVGSVAGPWGSVAGAGLGNMGGRSLRNTVKSALGDRDVPNTLKAIAIDQGQAGLEGAMADMTGQSSVGILRAVPKAGVGLATRIVKPNKVALKKVVNDSFGPTIADREKNVVQGLLDEHALTLGRSGSEQLGADIARAQAGISRLIEQNPDLPIPQQGIIDAGRAATASFRPRTDPEAAMAASRGIVARFVQREGLAPRPMGTVQIEGGYTAPAQPAGATVTIPGGQTGPGAPRSVNPATGQITEAVPPGYAPPATARTMPSTLRDPLMGGLPIARPQPGYVPPRTETVWSPYPNGWSPLQGSAPPEPALPLRHVDATRAGDWKDIREAAFGQARTSPEVDTIHAMNSARTAAEREAVPELGPLLDEQGRKIGMKHVLDEAQWRWGRNNPLPLDVAAAAASGKGLAAVAGLAKPLAGLPVAKGLYYGGNALNAVPPELWTAAFRAAVIEMLDALNGGASPGGSTPPTSR